jgi:hypothetical protein
MSNKVADMQAFEVEGTNVNFNHSAWGKQKQTLSLGYRYNIYQQILFCFKGVSFLFCP